ncbi:Dephospho-CoA kinase [Arthrobacter agilis]|uniref:dephospho-CoA kinase n=1 Tax=Arthrobacter agilis TaxID=37921 RepID=UPI000B54FB53|nr:dephospho-CoA kinase [Arthrobacter agilis]OUM44549.1 dephospho-CoA kinase [Arthrobacter agilis]VDR32000.1 Dephospho-CoA kinase [Arthrobacter agilis]
MLRIGLTGGIAAGKSAVAAELGRLGAVIVDADVIARDVVAPGTAGLEEVVRAFGNGVLGPDGALDRPVLGRLVFGDDAARERLNGIVHPRVRAEAARQIASAPADAVVVEDIPLLVETQQAARFHLVLVVDAPDELRIERMVRHRGMDRGDAVQRIAAQASRSERLAAADALLVNDLALEDLLAATAALWSGRVLPFARNLAEGRPAARNGGCTPVAAPRVESAPGQDSSPLTPERDASGLAGTRGLSGRTTAKLAAVLPAGSTIEAVGPVDGPSHGPVDAPSNGPVDGPSHGLVVGPSNGASHGAEASAPGVDDDVVRAHLVVRLAPGDDPEAVAESVSAAGFPPEPRGARTGAGARAGAQHLHGDAGVDGGTHRGLSLHGSADPAVEVAVTLSTADSTATADPVARG